MTRQGGSEWVRTVSRRTLNPSHTMQTSHPNGIYEDGAHSVVLLAPRLPAAEQENMSWWSIDSEMWWWKKEKIVAVLGSHGPFSCFLPTAIVSCRPNPSTKPARTDYPGIRVQFSALVNALCRTVRRRANYWSVPGPTRHGSLLLSTLFSQRSFPLQARRRLSGSALSSYPGPAYSLHSTALVPVEILTTLRPPHHGNLGGAVLLNPLCVASTACDYKDSLGRGFANSGHSFIRRVHSFGALGHLTALPRIWNPPPVRMLPWSWGSELLLRACILFGAFSHASSQLVDWLKAPAPDDLEGLTPTQFCARKRICRESRLPTWVNLPVSQFRSPCSFPNDLPFQRFSVHSDAAHPGLARYFSDIRVRRDAAQSVPRMSPLVQRPQFGSSLNIDVLARPWIEGGCAATTRVLLTIPMFTI
ncbi:hypothetical protein B0H16DRAFT_1449949 [Mycena metata]|uniref:Uncharacterized protein n=1 Tax=Mycena metata TaxID=1033252 RepID=A0AAD7JZS0_9AGAR|nr:hypothetical protein B0H16DRAFT_1449949 [Mycena metata]